jgi:hypothetical protein
MCAFNQHLARELWLRLAACAVSSFQCEHTMDNGVSFSAVRLPEWESSRLHYRVHSSDAAPSLARLETGAACRRFMAVS